MEKRTRLHEDVRIVSPSAALPEAGEMLDDELDAVIGGLEDACGSPASRRPRPRSPADTESGSYVSGSRMGHTEARRHGETARILLCLCASVLHPSRA